MIVGAGGHGLATAYYLAKEHGLRNIAVLEKGWLGGGNTGRNTTIVRSNYLWEESAALYDHALKLWEGLSQELNYNVMFSPRGVMMLAHNHHDVQVVQAARPRQPARRRRQRMAHARAGQGILPAPQHRRRHPLPVLGAALQRRGGTARHDAVAWGYARAAVARAASTSSRIARSRAIRRDAAGAVSGVETTRGADRDPKDRRRRRRPHSAS